MTSVRKLHKSSSDRMLAGVAGGLSEYFDVEVGWVRVAWVAVCFVTVGFALLLYIALAVVMPVDGTNETSSDDSDDPFDEEPAPTHRANRSRSFFAFVLISIGVVALAANFGILSWWKWDILWPLIPIGIGAAILVGRARRA